MIIVPPLGVVDFSFDRLSGAQLQAAGAQGVIRYACAGRASVNITAAEYADFTAHGIPVGITCEHSATFMTMGRASGRDFAQGALQVTQAAGMPDGPIFFAVDFPADESYMPALLDTLNGCADVLGPYNTGVYASYDVIDWLVRNSPYVAFWQTAAWSNGKTHPHAWLIQDRIWTQATPYKLDGANVDFSTVLGDWHPRSEDTLSQADVDAINAHTDAQINGLLTLIGQRFNSLDQADKQLAGAITTLYGAQKKDPTTGKIVPVDPTHTGIGDVARVLGALPEQIGSAVAAHVSNGGVVDPNITALLAEVKALNDRLATISWTLKAS